MYLPGRDLLEAKELKNQLINIFAKGGMVLHSGVEIIRNLIEVSENYDFSDSSGEIKVLGVYWNPKHDCFSFRVKIDLHELNTKRDVLSTISRIYDPLGLFRSCGGEGENLPSKIMDAKD
ncbi:hypothetical protein TNCV_1234411 [Trichonephila clavipes]|nr:hypothetical protein TNCV_1234411 [Trichonephila clavipes]